MPWGRRVDSWWRDERGYCVSADADRNGSVVALPGGLALIGVAAIAGMKKSNSNLAPCADWGRKVARFAETCPHCGRALSESGDD